jgi:hypothetical protein
MNAGMLWFDNDPKTALSAKIERAADYYRHKYGRDPNLCLIHPSMMPTDEADKLLTHCKRITVRPYRSVLPGHLWIGVEDKGS